MPEKRILGAPFVPRVDHERLIAEARAAASDAEARATRERREAAAREDALLKRLGEHVRTRSEYPPPTAPPPAEPPAVLVPAPVTLPAGLRPRMPQWAGIAAVVAALGGGAGIAQVLRPPPYNPGPQLEDIRADVADVGKKVDRIIERGDRKDSNDAVRWSIVQGAICNVNGGKPFARGVDCDAVTWDAPPNGAATPWKTQESWPRAERSP